MTEPSSPLAPHHAPPIRRNLGRRLAAFISIAALVLAADQWTKSLVRARLAYGESWPPGWELIRITHVENTGAAFGIFQGMGGALMIVALLLVAALTFVLLTQPWVTGRYTIALSAILGGAVGNLIDRIRLGAVTDFIDPTHYPAFNIADSAIVCGVLAILALTWLTPEPAPSTTAATAAPGDGSSEAAQ